MCDGTKPERHSGDIEERVARLEERLAQLCDCLADIARPDWDKRPGAALGATGKQVEPKDAVDCLDAWLKEIERRAGDAESQARSVRSALANSTLLASSSVAPRSGKLRKPPLGQ